MPSRTWFPEITFVWTSSVLPQNFPYTQLYVVSHSQTTFSFILEKGSGIPQIVNTAGIIST